MSNERRFRSNSGHPAPAKERRGLWIGNVRVSVGELASWQLGPDLTQPHQSVFSQRRRTTDRH